MELFDTHAHLDDPQLEEQLDQVLQRAADAGVAQVVAVGTTAESSGACVAMAQQQPTLLAAVGIQPNHVAEAGSGDWDRIVQLARSGKAAAIGETGLDRHWDYTPFALQQQYFDRHLRLCRRPACRW